MIGALLLLAVSVIPTGEEFTCTPTRVWDGDGPIWCAEGPRVRLAGNLGTWAPPKTPRQWRPDLVHWF